MSRNSGNSRGSELHGEVLPSRILTDLVAGAGMRDTPGARVVQGQAQGRLQAWQHVSTGDKGLKLPMTGSQEPWKRP